MLAGGARDPATPLLSVPFGTCHSQVDRERAPVVPGSGCELEATQAPLPPGKWARQGWRMHMVVTSSSPVGQHESSQKDLVLSQKGRK